MQYLLINSHTELWVHVNRIRLIRLILLMIVLLTSACSPGSVDIQPEIRDEVRLNPKETKSGIEEPNNQINTPLTAGSPYVTPVNITFSNHDFLTGQYQPIIAEFNRQHPDIQVTFVSMESLANWTAGPGFDAFKAFASLTESADSFSFAIGSSEIEPFLMDLTPRLNSIKHEELADFWPAGLAGCKDRSGQTLGIPISMNLAGIFYDQAALSQHGLPLPSPDWTWSDFKQIVSTFGINSQPARYGFADSPRQPLLRSLLPPTLLEQGQNNRQQKIDELTLSYQQLVAAGNLHPSPVNNLDPFQSWRSWYRLFLNQSYPPVMWPGVLNDSLPGYDDIDNQIAGKSPFDELAILNYGWIPFPAIDERLRGTTPVYTQCGVISKRSSHPQEVMTWLLFLTANPPQDGSPNTLGNLLRLPARITTTNQTGLWDMIAPSTREAITYALQHGYNGYHYQEEVQTLIKQQD